MAETSLGAAELRFAELIWANVPVSSGALVGLASEALGWKKSTTYTVLRNLCQAGIFENENAVVEVRQTKEEYLASESTQIVENRFEGSISKFVTAFTGKKKLSKKQIEELKRIIEENE